MIYERGRICFEPAKLGTDVFSQLYSTNNANEGLHIGHVLTAFKIIISLFGLVNK